MRVAWLGGLALLAAGGCEWAEEQPFRSAIADPQPEDASDPPEARAMRCTEAGFTLLLGPGRGCVRLDDVHGSTDGTPLRVIGREGVVVDLELTVRCRPFHNDETSFTVTTRGAACESGERRGDADACTDMVRFELVALEGELELNLFGRGTAFDAVACVREGDR